MDPHAWAWDVEALVLVPASCVAYALAVRRFPAPRWRVLAFAASQVLLLAVFLTPLETLALDYLLSAHLLQNVVLAEWAPGLFVLGLPVALADRLTAFRAVRFVTHPAVALPVWLATYVVWHLPALYDAALEHRATLLHLEHACYFAAGVLFWWPVLQRRHPELRSVTKAFYIFAAFLFASPIGLLLALLPEPIYSFYEAAPRIWGLSALTDQQIAGVTMALEQSVVFFAVFAFYFLRFLREEEAGPDLEAPGTRARA